MKKSLEPVKVPGPLVERIAEAYFCAVLNSLDIAIPDEIFRRQSPASQRLVMPVWTRDGETSHVSRRKQCITVSEK